MNCQQARRHWDLYYDSEGEAELHFHLNEHLERCPACAQWFDRQSRFESLIEKRLSAESDIKMPGDVDWSKILVGAGVPLASGSRSWMLMGPTLLALAASVLLILGLAGNGWRNDGSPSLSRLSAEVHQHVSAGSLRPEFESRSDIEVDQYLLKRVAFPVRCPPRKDSGFVVGGAGLCELAHQPAAYVVGLVDQRPVSIFVLPRESLYAFPRQREELRRNPLTAYREGDSEMVFSVIDQNVVLIVGDVQREKLTRVLKSYGTYPHAS